ncbi:MAG: transposase family protein [Muribaculaceae bacterium]|nr:transposase family protein [Muribaculaceae bacterium]
MYSSSFRWTDRLFFILVYLKNNPNQEYMGASFGMTQQQCGQWIHTLTEIFQMALDDAANTEIYRTIIKVEHAIGGAKIIRIVKDECRLRKNDFVDKIFHIAAGFHNWRFKTRA